MHSVALELARNNHVVCLQVLQLVPVPKWAFTNADIRHAERCLGLLGIRDCFEVRSVIGFGGPEALAVSAPMLCTALAKVARGAGCPVVAASA